MNLKPFLTSSRELKIPNRPTKVYRHNRGEWVNMTMTSSVLVVTTARAIGKLSRDDTLHASTRASARALCAHAGLCKRLMRAHSLHVHLAPFAPVGRRCLALVCAGHTATGTTAASAVVLVGMRACGDCRSGAGHVGEHQRRWRGGDTAVVVRAGRVRGRRADDAQQRPTHGHRGQRYGADGQRHRPRVEHRGR